MNHPDGTFNPKKRIDLANRLALRPKEAAQALGIGERTLRQLLPELPHVRVGGVVLLPVDQLREHLREMVRTEKHRGDAVVEEILRTIADGDIE